MFYTLEKIKQDFIVALDEVVMFIDLIDISKSQDFSFARKSKFYDKISISTNIIKEKINDTKDVQYNAIIISLYGSFELAIKKATNTFIKFCINSDFPLADKLSRDYILSVSKTFERNSFNESKNIIRDLHLFFNENDISKFSTDLSLHNYQNLKTTIVQKIANSVEINNFLNSVKNSNEFLIYIKDKEGLSSLEQAITYVRKISNPFQYIDEIVESRNLIAHQGRANLRFDNRIIKDFVMREFKIVVCHYIKMLQDLWYQNCLQYNKNIEEIEVLQIYNSNIVCFNTKNQIIDKNTLIIIQNGKHQYEIATINSIQHDRQNIEISKKNQDIGCCLNKVCKKTFKYFLYI